MGNRRSAGHLAALFTIIIWGTTFISTKVLLVDFRPVEILFFRFVMGFVALLLACPHRMKGVGCRQELAFVLAGLCGICIYYLLENIALTYTMASNVGVIISVAPFFTAILSRLFLKSEGKLRANFFIGFVVAMAGVALISFNGSKLELNPMGDLLAVLAAFVWACYSILTRKISSFGCPVILTTRRTFFYGILFMVPALFLFDFEVRLERFADMTYLLNILYLGLGASALCPAVSCPGSSDIWLSGAIGPKLNMSSVHRAIAPNTSTPAAWAVTIAANIQTIAAAATKAVRHTRLNRTTLFGGTVRCCWLICAETACSVRSGSSAVSFWSCR